jgi:hypothetical protein
VLTPNGWTETSADSYRVTGTAEKNSLVRIYRDLDNDESLDSGERPALRQQQLEGGDSTFEITVPLQVGNNDFVVTATDAAGNESLARGVPRIVRLSGG